MSAKKLGCGCLASLGIAATLFWGGRYIYTQGMIPFLGRQLTPITGAKVIPENAIAVGYIATDAENWSKLKQLNLSSAKKLLQEEIENFPNASDLKYQQDIQPWLGGAMVAMLPDETARDDREGRRGFLALSNRGVDFNLLMILGIKNKLKARDFLNKIKKDSEVKLTETKYQGVEITKAIDNYNDKIISALIDDKLIVAQNTKTIEQAIDSYKNNSSLITNSQTKSIFDRELNLENTLAEIYIPNYTQLIKNTIPLDTELPFLERLPIIDSIVIDVSTAKQGLKLRSITKLNPETAESEITLDRSELLNYFPDDTIALVNGRGIDKIWSNLVTEFKAHRETSHLLDIAKLSLRLTADIDLNKDIFGWMDGEFVLGLIKPEKPTISEFDIGLGAAIILETTQPNTAKEKLANIEQALARQLDLDVFEEQINNKTIVQYRDLNTKNVFSYGWLNPNHLLLTFGDSTWELIDLKQYKSLAKNKFFRTIIRELPENNLGYFYLDVAKILNTAHYLPLEELDDDVQDAIAILRSIKGIGTTATMPNRYTHQQDLFILFQED